MVSESQWPDGMRSAVSVDMCHHWCALMSHVTNALLRLNIEQFPLCGFYSNANFSTLTFEHLIDIELLLSTKSCDDSDTVLAGMVTTRQCAHIVTKLGLSDIICILGPEGTLTALTTHSCSAFKIYMRFHKYSTVKLEKWHQIAPVNTWFIATNYPITYTLTIYQQFSQIWSPEIMESECWPVRFN